MAEETLISWCDATFNPWIGCTRISPACTGCYAANLMETRMGVAKWGGPGAGVGTRVRTSPANWSKPLTWNKKAAARMASWDALPVGKRRGPRPVAPFVFCASLADVFDNEVPAEWRRDLFDLIRATPNLTWLLLTKRPGNILKMVSDMAAGETGQWWPGNAAIGCTVVNQEEADRDVPKLLGTKAALQPAFAFLSMEPLLGPVWIEPYLPDREAEYLHGSGRPAVDWVITGGETDQGAWRSRPSNPGWFRSIRDQCAAASVFYHHKQNGEWLESMHMQQERIHYDPKMEVRGSDVHGLFYKVGKALAGRRLDLVEHNGRPSA